MPPETLVFIAKYGYYAIFMLMFLQEMGVPSPLPNELVLTFAGYLSYKGILFLPFVFGTTILADWLGTLLLFTLFYFFSPLIVNFKQRIWQKPSGALVKLSAHVSNEKPKKLFLLRLAPFVRGYASIVAGMLRIRPKKFILITMISAITWTGFYISLGIIFGPYWAQIEQHIHNIKVVMGLVSTLLLLFLTARYAINALLN